VTTLSTNSESLRFNGGLQSALKAKVLAKKVITATEVLKAVIKAGAKPVYVKI